MTTMKIATAGSRTSKRWRTEDWTWERLLDRLRVPKRTGETMAEYQRMSKDERAARKDVGGFVGGALEGRQRKAGAVTERWLITLDADEAQAGVDDWGDIVFIYDYRMCLYSTHSHTPEHPRYRWIIPLSRAVTPDEYIAIARKVAEQIHIETMDTSTYQPERLMYWPSCTEDGEYVFKENKGQLLDPDELLREYGPGDAWRDTSRWPTSEREKEIVLREQRKQAEPTEKRGIVGVFCRCYDVPAAIDEFLPDVYDECDGFSGGDKRYTYAAGSTAAGAVIYGDGAWLYSNHSTDPAGGQLCNAFDLVRIHKFGARDAGQEAQETTRLPSYKAMSEWAATLPEVKRQLVEERMAETDSDFADMGTPAERRERARENRLNSRLIGEEAGKAKKGAAEPEGETEDPLAWASELAVNHKTGEVDPTIENAVLIMRNDPRLKGAIARNDFARRVVVRRDLPWRARRVGVKGDDSWTDADDANLLLFFESKWGINNEARIRNAWSVVVEENAYHPVREYLSGLEWDGVERLDTMLIRYMGAEDTEYTRAVTRKWVCAAAARMLQPGRKFDNMLVLIGPQGIGKSRLAMELSRHWFTDSLDRMDGKDAYEAL